MDRMINGKIKQAGHARWRVSRAVVRLVQAEEAYAGGIYMNHITISSLHDETKIGMILVPRAVNRTE